jgi:N-acyl-D-amino-acid deacylase
VLDLLFMNGTVFDGTGNPGYKGDVGVVDGRVVIFRGTAAKPASQRVIDVHDKVVAPGFIDMHSHSGLEILGEPGHLPKLTQGVTTEVIGVDGNSYAPFADPAELGRFVRFNAGLDGSPDVGYAWGSVESYLANFDEAVSVNIAMLVGNAALRIAAVGWEPREAASAEGATMRSLLRDAMAEGAFGLSTGLDYPPGSYASTDELADISRTAAELGGIYHTHVRYSLGDKFLDPFREAFTIAERSGCPLHLTHFYYKEAYRRGSGPLLDLLEEKIAQGADVTFDCYPSEWSSTRLSIFLPQWLQAGGPDATLQRLASASSRDAVRAELAENDPDDELLALLATTRIGNLRSPGNQRYEGVLLSEVARHRNVDVLEAFFDLLLEEDLRVTEVHPGPTTSSLAKFVRHPYGMVGTDSVFVGAKPSPRTYGSFPRILGEFVREERELSLREAIRKFTSFPAQRLGLPDRGLLRDGMAADITVFDPRTVRALATYDDPRRYSTGIEHVVVNGALAVDGGTYTGALAGRALKRSGSGAPVASHD